MKQGNKTSGTRAAILGMVAGGAVGMVAGLLIAPEEGQRMRRRLAYWLDRMADEAGSYLIELLNPQEANEARRSADTLVRDAREQADQILHDAEALMNEVRRKSAQRRPPATE